MFTTFQFIPDESDLTQLYAVAELLNRQWIGIELGNCDAIKIRMTSSDKDKKTLDKIKNEKNVLFTPSSVKLRKKNGFWLPEEEK